MCRSSVPSKLGAFTVIELLTTVAVFGILAALLLPTVTRAREGGMQATCLENMRQAGAAIHSYVTDTGYLPYHDAKNWDDRLIEQGIITDKQILRQGCPKNKSRISAAFGYNYMQLGNEDGGYKPEERNHSFWGRRSVAEVEKPAETIMLVDGHGAEKGTYQFNGWPAAIYWDARFWPVPKEMRNGSTGAFAPLGHNGNVNIVWVDGHGSTMDAAKAWGVEKGHTPQSFYYFARQKTPSSL